ncbi:MAG: family 20 glycosylhydrolase [Bacteroidales bacterium]
MRKRILSMYSTAALCFLTACGEQSSETKSYNQGINVIPVPAELSQQEGFFKLQKKTSVFASSPEAKTIAEFFAAKMNASTGYNITVSDKNTAGNIALSINEQLDVNNEGYKLNVTKEGVQIEAKTPQGLFYGMQTLMQLLPAEIESPKVEKGIAWNIPCVTIKDEPRFSYRGVMLDPCRHFIPVENIKKHLDVMALFKINTFHWHLTEDQGWRIEIKKYPKLTEQASKRIDGEGTEHGGFYTQEQIKEVVAYAQERFITVIPELEIPGHELAAISAYPELSCKGEPTTPRIIWGVEDIVMCPAKENTFQFIEDVIAEMVPLFPGEYFHIGGDECPKTSWKECPNCQALIRKEGLQGDKHHSSEEKLQSYVIRRAEQMLAKHGKKIIGWDEILEGGIAPTATVMSWRGEEGGIAAALMNHDVVMTPGSNGMYLDHYQGDPKIEPVAIGGYTTLEKTYSYNPVPDTLVAMNKSHFVKGVQCNLWSEYMYRPELVEYRAYPRVVALSEIAWSQVANKDYADFERRINNAYVRLDGHNINYHIPQPEQPNGSCNTVAFTDQAKLEFKTTRPVKMVYTTDGSDPTPQSTEYTAPLDINETTTLKIRSVLPSGKMSPVRNISVEKQALSPAKEVANTTPGLKMAIIDGTYLDTKALDNTKITKETTLKSLRDLRSQVKTSESMRNVNNYAAIGTGYVNIPEDGVYYFTSNNDEVWIDGKLIVDNGGEVKRFSRKDGSMALSKGLHEIKVVFLGHIMGGWPSLWDDASVKIRKSDAAQFSPITPEMLVF